MDKLLAVFSIALLAGACAHAESPASAGKAPMEMKATGTPGKVAATRTQRMTATVKAIDLATRTVTLQDPSGAAQTIQIEPQVKRLGEVAVGDTVEVDVEQDLVLELQSAGTETVPPTVVAVGDRAAQDQAPGGVVAAGVQATVTVTAIDSGDRMVSLQGPGGTLYRVKAGPEVKLEKLKVGDRLLATYIEAVAIKLEKASTK